VRTRLLDALASALSVLPLALAGLLAWSLAWTWWTVLPVRKAVARANLRLAFPEMDQRRAGRLLRLSLHDLALGYVELLHLVRRPKLAEQLFEEDGFEPMAEQVRSGKGCLLLCGHGGSWDLSLLAMTGRQKHLLGPPALAVRLPTTIIIRPPADPWVAGLIERARRSFDIELLPPRSSMAGVYDALRRGRVVMFPLDQRQRDGIEVPFFGRPALTAPSLAAAARRTGLPVFMGWPWRLGPGRHHNRFYPAFDLHWTDDREADIREATRLFTLAIEDRIREHPHGWLWLHRRWG
jgi:Kdo2-lipid IVA lauroyltransferase/acyltransferase